MADNLNHANVYTTNEIINVERHLVGPEDKSYFEPEKMLDKHPDLFKSHNLEQRFFDIKLNDDDYYGSEDDGNEEQKSKENKKPK